jgi:hypothetical protein
MNTTESLPATDARPEIEIRRTTDHQKADASVLENPNGHGVLIITSAPEDEPAHFIAG